MPEFNPGDYINRLLRSWWVIVLSMLVFGGGGYLFFTLRSPVYEATSSYEVWLDFNFLKVDREFTQYDEDLSINAAGNAYFSKEVVGQVIAEALKQGWIQDANELYRNSRLERKHSSWELRYQSTDRQKAVDMVNYWTTVGYQSLLELQESGEIPAYVRFSEPVPSVLPAEPVRHGRNNLILAGALLGLVAGIFLSSWLAGKKK